MKHLRLRLNMFGDDQLGTTYVIANVYPSDRKASADLRKELRNLEIPAGDNYYEYEEVEVPPGHYLVEVSLPSGQTLSREVDITEDGPEVIDLGMEAGPSPHEWLAWQHFQGNVGDGGPRRSSADWVRQSVERGALSSPRIETARRRTGMRMRSFSPMPTSAQVFWCVDDRPPEHAEKAWRLVHDIIRGSRPSEENACMFWDQLPADGIMEPVQPVVEDDAAHAYRFLFEGPMGQPQLHVSRHDAWTDTAPGRRYVLIRDPESICLVCAPVPWYGLEGACEETPFEVLSPLGSAGVTTAVRDPSLASIIGYLTRSSPRSARRLVDRARGMLFEKVANPLGAAAGAYVMLSTETERGKAHWQQWIGNLYRNFEWIPDGAIAYAILKLNHQETDEDVDEALDALLESCQRGIPYYSMGVRWLLDGLTSFADDDRYGNRHDEIKEWLGPVRAVARHTNFQQPFTSVQIAG